MNNQVLLENNIQQYQSQADYLANYKWSEYMEGIDDPWIRSCTATLLENEDNYLKQLHETTLSYSPGVATFEKFAFMGAPLSSN